MCICVFGFNMKRKKFKGLSERAANLIQRIESKKLHPCQPHKRLDRWKNLIQNYEISGEKIFR